MIAHTAEKGSRVLPKAIIKGFQEEDDKYLSSKIRNKDRSDRATHQQVLDRRTYLVLMKFFKAGILAEVNGCVSTGKEANVYHGMSPEKNEVAIKIYKTSILIFKDRDRYVTGEFRFRNGYAKSNPRQMVRVWAEKEYRNLLRLKQADILCPRPIVQRQHLLVMEFIGSDGVAAPRLKDAVVKLGLSEGDLKELYWEGVHLVQRLYQECHLVHADFSEYNILVHQGHLWVIDVSQSVEHEHPHALEFLRSDIVHLNAFFRGFGISVLTTREVFEFVVDVGFNTKEKVTQRLEELRKMADERGLSGKELEDEDEGIFLQSYIPRTLHHLDIFAMEKTMQTEMKLKREREMKSKTGALQSSESNASSSKGASSVHKSSLQQDKGEDEKEANEKAAEEQKAEKEAAGADAASTIEAVQRLVMGVDTRADEYSRGFGMNRTIVEKEKKRGRRGKGKGKEEEGNEEADKGISGRQEGEGEEDEEEEKEEDKEDEDQKVNAESPDSLIGVPLMPEVKLPPCLCIYSVEEQLRRVSEWEVPLPVTSATAAILKGMKEKTTKTGRKSGKRAEGEGEKEKEGEEEEKSESSDSDSGDDDDDDDDSSSEENEEEEEGEEDDEYDDDEDDDDSDSMYLDEDEKQEEEELAMLLLHAQLAQNEGKPNASEEEEEEGNRKKLKRKNKEFKSDMPPIALGLGLSEGIPLPARKRGVKEEPELKKLRKQEVKREKQEKRKTKIPKSVKQKATKSGRRK
eukprot:MONOS_2609.1-p1 / transcript=MONOS_2609.1 / gene=MONOS_2609 / organism=Monocercomonoides_exilis_PA203 / gene_product=putative protein serine / transcript_product=putative protein serine / location=Mono_scaffold00055:15181-17594(-) / protein_length=742 / sequence_SO=supercontig / SO=protein_coding / is_pseudo=false